MRRKSPLLAPAVVLAALVLAVAPASAQSGTQSASGDAAADSVFARAQRLASGGDGPAARALVDSVLGTSTDGSMLRAEALYWRAALAATAAEAERDYLRVSIEYPLSRRADDALLRLAQLESARGDRTRARHHLARLLREHPTSELGARAAAMAAGVAFDDGDVAAACAAMDDARARMSPGDVELRNQMNFLAPRCTAAAREAAARETAAADAPAAESPAAGTSSAAGFSVQVAAYRTQREARALADRLARRGFQQTRVVPGGSLYRVRVGRYATRADAVAAQGRMKRSGVSGIVVAAEPR